ncbi:hypothetical protein C4D60_Mb07t24800 [Musa balbisiana]|uniref:proteasome endopeptidase complex n=1 Tax=Musa balbisiana TaxID=52838 RepID=A0A4S8JHS5_MUSBA|nr:hypothetical protein C4D60_Mb07t24800 [Musa balbisiana]
MSMILSSTGFAQSMTKTYPFLFPPFAAAAAAKDRALGTNKSGPIKVFKHDPTRFDVTSCGSGQVRIDPGSTRPITRPFSGSIAAWSSSVRIGQLNYRVGSNSSIQGLIRLASLDDLAFPAEPMAQFAADAPTRGGFSFDLCQRNEMLLKKGNQLPNFRKTGTTIVGLVFEDGVILGADTRATEGPIVADKNCEKIHYMAPNIYCCGAGTAADTEAVTDMVSSQLQLHRYATGRESRVITALTLLKSHLFSYQGYVSAALVLGGVDITGPHLHTVYPHGSTDTLPFATMGSGSLAAMARDEGIKLVSEAICSGIFNDLGSGSNVDVCVITRGQTEYLRNHQLPNPRTYVSSRGYNFLKGHTEVLSTKITPLKSKVEAAAEVDAMEE